MATSPRHPTMEVREKREIKRSRDFQMFNPDTDIVPDSLLKTKDAFHLKN